MYCISYELSNQVGMHYLLQEMQEQVNSDPVRNYTLLVKVQKYPVPLEGTEIFITEIAYIMGSIHNGENDGHFKKLYD